MIYGICVEFQPELNKDFRLDSEVARVMQNLGYVKKYGSLWINENSTVVEDILNVEKLFKTLEWLKDVVSECNLIGIKDVQDLSDCYKE